MVMFGLSSDDLYNEVDFFEMGWNYKGSRECRN